MVIVGHGVRTRRMVGPVDHGDDAGLSTDVCTRRYRCRACSAVLVVVPRGVLPRRRYTAFAIAWALALFGLVGLTAPRVREKITSWRAAPHTANLAWAALRRWVRAVRDRRLFLGLPRSPPSSSLRRVAERAAMALAGSAPVERRALDDDVRAGYGGVVMPLGGITG
jgi:hypothetical protein